MVASSEDISDTMNVALACAAAFQAVHIQNAKQVGSITSIALPGLGAATGKTPVEICADLMWSGYNLFRRRAFANYAAMRAALEAELGELGPSSTGKSFSGGPPIYLANQEDDFPPSAQNKNGEHKNGEHENGVDGKPDKDEEVDFDDF
jgi:hypothetical protein